MTEQVEQTQQQQENIEMRVRWNDEALDRAFERIWALEARVETLEAAAVVADAEDTTEVKTESIEETVIKEPANTPPAKKKKRGAIGLW